MYNGKLSNKQQLYSIHRYRMEEGPMQGLRIIDCSNGKLRFLLNESKALDMMQAYFEGENLSFVSKNGFLSRELPFMKRFEGGMLYTCGLDGVGGVEGVETHGTLHNIPATLTRAEAAEDGLVIEGFVRDSALFGKNLVLKRRIFSAYGSDSIEIRDTLVNEGEHTENYALLYHINLGFPLLDEGGRIEFDASEVTPRTPWAAAHLEGWNEIAAPKTDFEETCYYLTLREGHIAYVNERAGKTLTLRFDKQAMPNFMVWKSECCGDYALGLEPSTTKLDGDFAYRTLAAGESITFQTQIALAHHGK